MFERNVRDCFSDLKQGVDEMRRLVDMVESCSGMVPGSDEEGWLMRKLKIMFNKGKEMDFLVQVLKIALQHLGLQIEKVI